MGWGFFYSIKMAPILASYSDAQTLSYVLPGNINLSSCILAPQFGTSPSKANSRTSTH